MKWTNIFGISCRKLKLELSTEREIKHAGKEKWTMHTKALGDAQKMVDRLEQLRKCITRK